jgi:hypothetical protein
VLSAFRQQFEQTFQLFPALLEISQIVDDRGFETGHALDEFGQFQLAFGPEQLPYEKAATCQQDRSFLMDRLFPNAGSRCFFPESGFTKISPFSRRSRNVFKVSAKDSDL